jgi:uncharacterized repeat protein (TIGR01451 family)
VHAGIRDAGNKRYPVRDTKEGIMRKRRSRPRTPFGQQLRFGAQLARPLAALLLLFLFSSGLTTIGRAEGEATVSVDPATAETFIGSTVTTEIRVDGVPDTLPCYGFTLLISFDPTKVAAESITPGDFLGSGGMVLGDGIDNTAGTIDYTYFLLGGSPSTGSGALASITWRGLTEGTSPVHFDEVFLGAEGPQWIPVSAEDGQITVGKVDLELTKEVDDPSPAQGSQVVFTLTVDNAGTIGATGVEVTDYWPSERLQYDSHSGGSYDEDTGIWDVGTLAAGESTALQITGTVLQEGGFVNAAEVSACNEPDQDSTPGNFPSVPLEDDEWEVGGVAGPTVVTVSSFTTRSNTGMPVAVLWLGLASLVGAAAAGLLWARRRAR